MKKKLISKTAEGYAISQKTGKRYNQFIYANYPDSERLATAHMYTTFHYYILACRLAVADYNRFIQSQKAANHGN